MSSTVTRRVGIVALDLDPARGRGTRFFIVKCAKNNTSWPVFVKRCNDLLTAKARVSHAELVWAALCYSTMDKTSPEIRANGDILYAFMGDAFDLEALGTWREVTQQVFNEETDLDRILIWTYNYPQ